MRASLCVLLAFASVLSFSATSHGDDLIPVGSEWRWLHPTDGVDPGKADEDFHKTWHTLDFDDTKWKAGKDKEGPHGGFGYGEEDFEGVDIGTPPADDPADTENGVKRRTAYFRHAFETDKRWPAWCSSCSATTGSSSTSMVRKSRETTSV